MNELRVSQRTVSQEAKEQKKAEKMAVMMKGLDPVNFRFLFIFNFQT